MLRDDFLLSLFNALAGEDVKQVSNVPPEIATEWTGSHKIYPRLKLRLSRLKESGTYRLRIEAATHVYLKFESGIDNIDDMPDQIDPEGHKLIHLLQIFNKLANETSA